MKKEKKKAEVISIAISKGGVGKSSIAQFLIEKYREDGYKVLGLDLDQQANLTRAMGIEDPKATIADLMRGDAKAEEAIYKDMIAGGEETALFANCPLDAIPNALTNVLYDYDYIIVDTNAKIDRLTLSALTITDKVIIPVTADSFAIGGINAVIKAVNAVRANGYKNVGVAGVLFNRWNGRLAISSQLKAQLAEDLKPTGIRVFDTSIRESVAIREAHALGLPLNSYARRSNAYKDLCSFYGELNR